MKCTVTQIWEFMADLELSVCKVKVEPLIHNCHRQHHMRKAWDLMSVKNHMQILQAGYFNFTCDMLCLTQ